MFRARTSDSRTPTVLTLSRLIYGESHRRIQPANGSTMIDARTPGPGRPVRERFVGRCSPDFCRGIQFSGSAYSFAVQGDLKMESESGE